jgi:hypothetical protein
MLTAGISGEYSSAKWHKFTGALNILSMRCPNLHTVQIDPTDLDFFTDSDDDDDDDDDHSDNDTYTDVAKSETGFQDLHHEVRSWCMPTVRTQGLLVRAPEDAALSKRIAIAIDKEKRGQNEYSMSSHRKYLELRKEKERVQRAKKKHYEATFTYSSTKGRWVIYAHTASYVLVFAYT